MKAPRACARGLLTSRFFLPQIFFFWEKYVAEKKERKKNNHKNSGHFVPLQRLRAAHAHRSDQYQLISNNIQYICILHLEYLSHFKPFLFPNILHLFKTSFSPMEIILSQTTLRHFIKTFNIKMIDCMNIYSYLVECQNPFLEIDWAFSSNYEHAWFLLDMFDI